MKTFVSVALVLGVSLFATGCGEKEEAKYVRPSAGCKCAEKNACEVHQIAEHVARSVVRANRP